LLAEIHHRVKNNLAVVRGLLNMQLHVTTDETAKATLRESVNRVSAMALIHQKLYTKDNPDAIDMRKYADDLVKEISSSYHLDGKPEPVIRTEIQDITLTLVRAVPCGLILNELLTNAFKHAFPDGKRGIINISIRRKEGLENHLELIVSDNGGGMPNNFDPVSSSTLGITIVESLSEQLDGKFTYESSSQGTRMIVNFPMDSPTLK
jgi:two-component sensor histidine kinase